MEEIENKVGILCPQLCHENFTRPWEVLDMKQKFNHFQGLQIYTQPLVEIAPIFLLKEQLPYRDFVEQFLLPLQLFPFIDKLYKKFGTTDMHKLCQLIAKYFHKEISNMKE